MARPLPDLSSPKRCPQCKQTFPRTTEFFHRNRAKYDGLSNQCKACNCLRVKEWQITHPERARQNHKEWREAHREQDYEVHKRWRENNTEKSRSYSKAYRQRHPERRKESVRKWEQNNPEKVRAAVQRKRARRVNAEGFYTAADVLIQLNRQKNKCFWCGKKLSDTYDVDHVIPLFRGGDNYPSNIVISCPTCNQSKGAKLPHEWEGSGGRLL